MSGQVSITEKRLLNKRFRKTEEAILQAFLKEGAYTSMNTLAKKSGVSRSTVYHHHHAIREIIPDYEKYLINKFRYTIRKTSKSNSRASVFYFKTLCFITTNKKFFQILIHYNGNKIFRTMIFELSPHIKNSMHLPKNSSTLFTIYVGEVTEVIGTWSEVGFKDSEIDNILEKILFLTSSARTRLAPLLD